MATQSSIWFSAVAPAVVNPPTTGYVAVFISDGTNGTIANSPYKKDSTGAVTSLVTAYTDENAQDAVGTILTNTSTVNFTYDDPGNIITAVVPDAAITNTKLAPMTQATFKMRAAAAGTGAPIDGTAAQAKTALAITASDVSGLGTAATMAATAFDTAGAATTAANTAQANAIAASQPVNTNLTAIAALSTTAYGRGLLTLLDAAATTSALNTATQTLKGLLSATDKLKVDTVGAFANLTGTASTSGIGDTALLTAQIPASTLVAGEVLRAKLFGVSSSVGTLIFRVHIGATGTTSDATVWTSLTSAAQNTNQRAGFDALITIRSTGASGTVQCEGVGFAHTALLPGAVTAVTTPTINTTAAVYITLSATCSFNTFTAQQAVIEGT